MRDPTLLLKSYLEEHVTVLTRSFLSDQKPQESKENPSEQPTTTVQEFKGTLVAFDEHWNIGLLINGEFVMIKGEIIVYIGQE